MNAEAWQWICYGILTLGVLIWLILDIKGIAGQVPKPSLKAQRLEKK